MKLEQQVVSLELAQKLKKLGVKQESYFGWVRTGENNQEWKVEASFGHGYSAFTVAELGEMIKKGVHWANSNFTAGYLEWNERLDKWEYELPKGGWISCDTEADARAKTLIYLLENKLITPSLNN